MAVGASAHKTPPRPCSPTSTVLDGHVTLPLELRMPYKGKRRRLDQLYKEVDTKTRPGLPSKVTKGWHVCTDNVHLAHVLLVPFEEKGIGTLSSSN